VKRHSQENSKPLFGQPSPALTNGAVSLVKLVVAQLVKIFPEFYGLGRFITEPVTESYPELVQSYPDL
jgi:hypothetical protein